MIMPGIVAANAGGAIAPVTRAYFAAEQAGTVTGSDAATNVELVSLTATLSAGDWVIFWTLELQCDGGIPARAVARVAEDGVEIDQAGLCAASGTDQGGWGLSGGFYIHAGTGAPVTFSIAVRSASDIFTTVPSGRNGRIAALKLGADDVYVEDTGLQSVASVTPADMATLAFTPPSPSAYLLIGYARVGAFATGSPHLQLSDGVDDSAVLALNGALDTEDRAAFRLWLRPGLSSAQTITLQAFGGTTHNVDVRGARILALRLADFTHAFSAVANSDEQGVETAYADSLVLARTLTATDVLTLACWSASPDSASNEIYPSRLLDPVGVANTVEQVSRTPAASIPAFAARVGAIPAGRRSWAIQRRAPAGEPAAVIDAGAIIVALQLN